VCTDTLTKIWSFLGASKSEVEDLIVENKTTIEDIAAYLQTKFPQFDETVEECVKLFISKMEHDKQTAHDILQTDYTRSNHIILHDAFDRREKVNVTNRSAYCVARDIFLEVLQKLKPVVLHTTKLQITFKDSSKFLRPSSFIQRSRLCSTNPELTTEMLLGDASQSSESIATTGGRSHRKSKTTRGRKHRRKTHRKHVRKTMHGRRGRRASNSHKRAHRSRRR
jgi:hypothetical protein